MTHPRGFNVTEPSVAAGVASMDANTARYAARVRLQGHRVEIIQARAYATGSRQPCRLLCASWQRRQMLCRCLLKPLSSRPRNHGIIPHASVTLPADLLAS